MNRLISPRQLPLLALIAVSTCGAADGNAAHLQVPARFERNQGQWPEDVKYLARQGSHSVSLTADSAVVSVGDQAVTIRFEDANPRPVIEGLAPRGATTNYFVGQRPKWVTGVPQYGRVRCRDVYPGIDLDYYWNEGRLEFDFVVRPGADPNRIRMRFDGAGKLHLSESGDLLVEVGGQQLKQLRPEVYQKVARGGELARTPIDGSYAVAGNRVRFALGQYEPDQALVIDPVLVYSTYLGGARPDVGTVIAIDAAGKIWVAGNTTSEGLPSRGNPFKDVNVGGQDIFVARFDPSLEGDASLTMLSYFGGTGMDEVRAIHAAPSGFIALAGVTTSTDFPMAGNTYQEKEGGERDGFVAVINPFESGEFLFSYSSYLGGSGNDTINAVAVDFDDNIHVTGYTTSDDFPVSGAPLQQGRRGGYDLFITKLAPSRAPEEGLVYSTYLGAESTDVGMSIAADASGFVYVGGYTFSQDFPLAGNVFRDFASGDGDAFLVKIDPSQGFPDALVYGSYFGGTGFDKLFHIRLDAAGGVVLVGYTVSDDFPTTPSAFQSFRSGDSDLFISRLDLSRPASKALTYSTYLGGTSTDVVYGADVDGSNRVAVTGYTLSVDFPAKGRPLQNGFGGAIDAFVAWVDPAASGDGSLLSSSYLGGDGIDVGYAVAADFRGRAFVTGYSASTNIPVSEGGFTAGLAGIYDAFVAAIDF